MRSVIYNDWWADEDDGDEILQKLASHTIGNPTMDDTSASIEWIGESDDESQDSDEDILFLLELQEDYGLHIDDAKMESFLSGDLKIAELISGMDKNAALSSPEDKARARIYRIQNAIALKRKAKKRRKLIKQGLKRPMQRIGSAAGGYSFIPSAGGTVGNVKAMTGGSGGESHHEMNFNPHSSPSMSIMHTQSLSKMAAENPLVPANLQQGAALNPQNPIAGMMGFPKAPPKVTSPSPLVKTPKPKRPVNFKKLLPKSPNLADNK